MHGTCHRNVSNMLPCLPQFNVRFWQTTEFGLKLESPQGLAECFDAPFGQENAYQ